jgi:hydroxypyruvate reductase
MPGVAALACDTDGIDGSEDNAGAILLPDSASRAARLGLRASAYLAAHDSYSWFAALDNLVVTGPTRTNINDYRVILVGLPIQAINNR